MNFMGTTAGTDPTLITAVAAECTTGRGSVAGTTAAGESTSATEVVVAVEFMGVNPVDIWVTRGTMAGGQQPLPFVPGLEAVGSVDGRRYVIRGAGLGVQRDGLLQRPQHELALARLLPRGQPQVPEEDLLKTLGGRPKAPLGAIFLLGFGKLFRGKVEGLIPRGRPPVALSAFAGANQRTLQARGIVDLLQAGIAARAQHSSRFWVLWIGV